METALDLRSFGIVVDVGSPTATNPSSLHLGTHVATVGSMGGVDAYPTTPTQGVECAYSNMSELIR